MHGRTRVFDTPDEYTVNSRKLDPAPLKEISRRHDKHGTRKPEPAPQVGQPWHFVWASLGLGTSSCLKAGAAQLEHRIGSWADVEIPEEEEVEEAEEAEGAMYACL